MTNLKVVKVNSESIEFTNDIILESKHQICCCENHWIDFEHVNIEDFDDLEFDLSNDNFFERIEGYGIALLPINGHPIRIAGYGSDNGGYYSDNLTLVISNSTDILKEFDITECQSEEKG